MEQTKLPDSTFGEEGAFLDSMLTNMDLSCLGSF